MHGSGQSRDSIIIHAIWNAVAALELRTQLIAWQKAERGRKKVETKVLVESKRRVRHPSVSFIPAKAVIAKLRRRLHKAQRRAQPFSASAAHIRVNDMGKTKKSAVRKADRPRGKQKKRDVAAWGTPPAQRALRKLTDLAAKHEHAFQRELEAILKALGTIDREVASRAVSVLGRSAAARWLTSRNITLASTTPLCALAEGRRDQVLAALGRIEHGIGA